MKTRNRREREFQQREVEFLDLARRMIAEGGLASFNMDRLAEATEYSKGTVYQHFSSKEDLISALAIQSLGRRVAWFERAVRFAGTTRERMQAITAAEEIFVTLQPLHFRSELLIKVDDFSQRASEERRNEVEALERRCFGSIQTLVEEAIRLGDLTLPAHRSVGDVIVGFAAIHIGTFTIMNSFASLYRSLGVTDPFRALRDQVAVYLDGLGWRPLSNEADHATAHHRIFREVFPEESRLAGLAE
ncbi:Bacterial regulatory protein, tetR family [Gemmata obscuriglobus]|uniref:TetR/AcrR family transcriptional regulator n=1 Tax=Gemmata obscuriglobus TaxID=114 RepID=A0A2Z3H6N7_9BACT|nr:TetR/AcrR family transcriptional regulator [Gemmata obscuriglobus]AWM36630.1 TetR/AcrR family transcriptional regulator [Gemmata obscuriglobus]QEG30734.1 Bacterial regulatory protein, tetR family [Gemmata obscuriglobus]VTS10064.1 family transcriptional regulator : Transcriptional regulator, TetR family OS=Pirellula staleyi (strain ATCC 27377 / DSM 6068 / ICPB 4128) GN=Psta_1008 PE=4 SV=1: TetR_N [Gemmata obscuriglobus UQM 2246]